MDGSRSPSGRRFMARFSFLQKRTVLDFHPPWLIGDIIHVNIFGKHSIFLNSWEVANELLEKRSAIYSDRPRLVMTSEVYEKLLQWSDP